MRIKNDIVYLNRAEASVAEPLDETVAKKAQEEVKESKAKEIKAEIAEALISANTKVSETNQKNTVNEINQEDEKGPIEEGLKEFHESEKEKETSKSREKKRK